MQLSGQPIGNVTFVNFFSALSVKESLSSDLDHSRRKVLYSE